MFEGRVELCIDETWTTICADGAWTNIDANIACRQAGYAATGMHVLFFTYLTSYHSLLLLLDCVN